MKRAQVCVYIENEAQLQEARELIKKRGESHKIDEDTFRLSFNDSNYLYYGEFTDDWGLGYASESRVIITLSELEEILKSEA